MTVDQLQIRDRLAVILDRGMFLTTLERQQLNDAALEFTRTGRLTAASAALVDQLYEGRVLR